MTRNQRLKDKMECDASGIHYCLIQFNSVQFKMVSMRSKKPVRSPPSLSEVFHLFPRFFVHFWDLDRRLDPGARSPLRRRDLVFWLRSKFDYYRLLRLWLGGAGPRSHPANFPSLQDNLPVNYICWLIDTICTSTGQ